MKLLFKLNDIRLKVNTHMGESFQYYSWIQDFEANFPQKVSLEMLNLADYNSISHLLQFL